MLYQFSANGSRLHLDSINEGTTANVNSYECQIRFLSEDWNGRECFAVFKVGADVYTQVLTHGHCIIPSKALEKVQTIYIGIYGIKPEEETNRLSTEWTVLNISQGAYSDEIAPIPPKTDVWEQYIAQIQELRETIAPYIGENKNWYYWDEESGSYIDSGEKAVPEKGVDYYTSADIDALGLEDKVDKIEGKGLSTNDYTDAERAKVENLPEDTQGVLDGKADKSNTYGGFAGGGGADLIRGGGGAIGAVARSVNGGAAGSGASSIDGGAVGADAITSDGFAGGRESKTIDEDGTAIDAIQLGKGTNSVPKSLQVYDHTVMNPDGSLPYVHEARPYVKTAVSDTLSLNTIYDLGEQTELSIKLPSANVGNFIQVDFICGDTPTIFTIDAASSAVSSNYDFTPEQDKVYSLFFDYGRLTKDLYGWRFSYAEYTYTEV